MRSNKGQFDSISRRDGGDRILAPSDCTNTDDLDAFIRSGLDRVHGRHRSVTVDLSPVRSMNSALLAAVIFLARESMDRGLRIQLSGVTDQFRDWASTLGVWSALVKRGIVTERSTT